MHYLLLRRIGPGISDGDHAVLKRKVLMDTPTERKTAAILLIANVLHVIGIVVQFFTN